MSFGRSAHLKGEIRYPVSYCPEGCMPAAARSTMLPRPSQAKLLTRDPPRRPPKARIRVMRCLFKKRATSLTASQERPQEPRSRLACRGLDPSCGHGSQSLFSLTSGHTLSQSNGLKLPPTACTSAGLHRNFRTRSGPVSRVKAHDVADVGLVSLWFSPNLQ